MVSEQRFTVPLTVGSRVVLYEEIQVERDGGEDVGSMSGVMFEDYVEQYVPATGLLVFEESDVGRAEFTEMVDEAAGIEILTDAEIKEVQ